MIFVKMIRENFINILTYLSTLLIVWRIHEYAHLLTASYLGIKITMGLDTWISNISSPALMASGPLSTLTLASLGSIMTFKSSNIKKVIGFYMTFSGFMMTIGSLIFGLNKISFISLHQEITWKLMIFPLIFTLLLLEVRYGQLGLKLACVFWLTIITIATSSVIKLLDTLIWQIYHLATPLSITLYGQILIAYLIDILIFTIIIYTYVKLKHKDETIEEDFTSLTS